MSGGRVPWTERVLLRLLLGGAGAEHVVGDVLERYGDDVSRFGARRARRRLRRQIVASAAAWWRPSSVWRRHGPVRGVEAGPGLPTDGGGETMGAWIQDLGAAARSLSRRPTFALGVASTLGLGIGATTTIYSVVDGVLLRPLPYEAPRELAAVGTVFPTREWDDQEAGLQHLAGISMLNFRDFAERSRSFESLAGIEASSSILLPDLGDGPELVPVAGTSSELFGMLGVTPASGRLFLPEEHEMGADMVLLITYGAWQRRFGGDPAVVGRSLDKVGSAATIVGVLPKDFRPPEAFFPSAPDFWVPLQPDHPRYGSRGMRSLYVAGRLAPGVTVEEARAEAREIAASLAADFPDGNVYPDGSYFGIGVNGLHEQTVGTTGRTLRIFLGAAGLLLLLAAMNAATLLLARALDRVRELGVRVALGAGRGRVVRLLLGEAGLLAVVGGLFGVALAYGGVSIFLRFAPSSIPRLSTVAVDARVLAVSAAMTVVAGLAAGLLPAARLVRRGPWERLARGGRGEAEATSRLRSALVGGQVTVAVVLLSGAALLFSSFVRIRSVVPGFDPDDLVSLTIPLKRPNAPPGEEPWQAWDLALDEVKAVPGVVSAAGVTDPPFQSPSWAPRVLLPGEPPETWREGVAGYAITPGYLQTVGTSLLSGRDIEPSDGPDAEPVALVNETFVRTVLNQQDPLGATLRSVEGDTETVLRVVGVVGDVVQGRAEEGHRAAIYVPYTQWPWPWVHAVVRTGLPAETIVPELRKAVARFSPLVPPSNVRTMRDRMAATRTTPRFQSMLIGAFALVALLLASAGLYGSLSHAVGRRRREVGVRMALGAARSGVLRLVLAQGMRPALVGLALGVVATLVSARVLAGFLYEVEPDDPATLAGVALALVLVSVAACLIPARRATAVDPVEVLRAE